MLPPHGTVGQIALYKCCSCENSNRTVIGLAQPSLCKFCSHERCAKCDLWGSGDEDGGSFYGAERGEKSARYTTESRRTTNAMLPQRRATTSNTPQSPLLDDFGFRTATGRPGSSHTGSPLRSRDDPIRVDMRTASGRIHKAAGSSPSLRMRGSSFRQPQWDNLQTQSGSGSRTNFYEGGMYDTPSQMGTPVSLSGDSLSSTSYLSGASGSPWDGSVYDTPQLPELENFNLGDSALAAIDADPSVGPPTTKRKLRDHPECPVRLEELLRKKPKKRRMTQPQQKVLVADPNDQKLMDRKRNTMHARNSRLNRTTYMEGLEMYQEWATPKIERLEQQLESQKELIARLQRENAALKPTMETPSVPTGNAQEFSAPEPSFEGDWAVMGSSKMPRPSDADHPDGMSFFPSLDDEAVSIQRSERSFVSRPPLGTPQLTFGGTPILDRVRAAQHEHDLRRTLGEGGMLNPESTTPTEPPDNIQWSYSRQPTPGASSARILPHDQDVFFADPNLDPSLVQDFVWSSDLNNEERPGDDAQHSPWDATNEA